MPENNADLALLTDAARKAGEIAMRYQKDGFQTWEKPGGAGPVTEADLEIDAMLRDSLCAARPDYGWLSEETPDTPDRLAKSRVFIVDPIDGTRAFVDRRDGFSIALSVVENKTPVAAVVYLPQTDRLYVATAGQGATLNGTALTTSRKGWIEGADILGSKSSFSDAHWRGGPLPVQVHFRPSLAHRFCLVAEGRFDAMLTLRDAWEWDVAAGALIAQEAGARCVDLKGRALQFNSPTGRGPGFIAANPMLLARLSARLKPPFTLPA